MPANTDIAINAAAYTKISENVTELTFQNKAAGKIELTAVATGEDAPAATVEGIQALQHDGRTKMVVADVFLHLGGAAADVYAKTLSGAGVIYVNHA